MSQIGMKMPYFWHLYRFFEAALRNFASVLLFAQVILHKGFIAVHICAHNRVAHDISVTVDKQGGGDADHVL